MQETDIAVVALINGVLCVLEKEDYRENNMPDSPDTKSQTSPAPLVTESMPRPASIANTTLNGSLSPHGSVNGRSPSPHDSSPQQQLPPACGARQLSKLKRFLTTLQQFGSDISPEIGERVRTLVLGLVNSTISIEDFHAKLQEATNFPLRPFVIPFLKANLPLLQRELLHCARMAKQTPAQYLSRNEHIILAARSTPPMHEQADLIGGELNDNGKRRTPDSRPKENGVGDHYSDPLHPSKRLHPISPGLPRVSPGSMPHVSGPLRLEDMSLSRELRERESRLYTDRDLAHSEDDWRQVDSTLNCIMSMVERTKRTLSVLQHRAVQDREELALWARRHAEGAELDVKKRADEAVSEVKRQAVSELQKAVAAAEQKANELIQKERAKMEHAIEQARREATEEAMTLVNSQEDTSENCWNCGRKASETCSGCNTARYCGSFCQHKDWENHHKVCGQHAEPASSTTTRPSPVNSITSSKSAVSRSATPTEQRNSTSSESSR
ncbi:PREDICTED: protein CBFA2T1-like isoform X2 [Priapulus caudatus]|uniref:Protein CBFA2T1-like isoform X2 n=1 Tax=Priapulus caudatus TaxID=37621 RepID=A0ABM1E0D8_PRICU|nr:PREDICTED: protein CBFA2T1-like isoform X2 [Priapulus caudatus]